MLSRPMISALSAALLTSGGLAAIAVAQTPAAPAATPVTPAPATGVVAPPPPPAPPMAGVQPPPPPPVDRLQPQQVMLLTPVAIDRMQPDNVVAVKGTVAEIFGNKFILQDDSGRALVELGPRGEGGNVVTRGEQVMVQGRFDRGFVVAEVLSHSDGRAEAFGPPRPPRPGVGPDRRLPPPPPPPAPLR